MKLIADKKAEIINAAKIGQKREILRNRDILTLLINANMSDEILENHRPSDEDVLAQISTFLVAGHERTSNTTTWCLFALAYAPEIQRKLRDELFGVPTEQPSMDELNDLPYLDAVVRETMRFHAPVADTNRHSASPFTDTHGQAHDVVRVQKGCVIFISIFAMNKSKDLWGQDAHDFNPERWITGVPDTVQQIPGVWSNM
ncbi:uncharacterized protein FIBRA_06310 [Fibroporia radiculosa]|uniref:Cytochrome P450 n=1 Tax=Fibroporia radiculosa TaxID=599839 RepID=J4GB40_9APHY|nr:uncharacterized protein FIBRA_06310 [Fibroporia radiculosa]CCM04148.1 predicted protein [Fibroporia radiculosa]